MLKNTNGIFRMSVRSHDLDARNARQQQRELPCRLLSINFCWRRK